MKRTLQIAGVAIALTLTACTSDGEQPPEQIQRLSDNRPMNDQGAELIEPGSAQPPRGALPSPADVDDTDAEAVADSVAVTSYVTDTRIDNSPADGLRRATRWLTESYAEAAAQPRPATGGRDWAELAAIDGYTTATVTDSDETEGGKGDGRSLVLTRIVTVTTHDRADTPVRTERIGVVVNVIRNDSRQWRVEAITTI